MGDTNTEHEPKPYPQILTLCTSNADPNDTPHSSVLVGGVVGGVLGGILLLVLVLLLLVCLISRTRTGWSM